MFPITSRCVFHVHRFHPVPCLIHVAPKYWDEHQVTFQCPGELLVAIAKRYNVNSASDPRTWVGHTRVEYPGMFHDLVFPRFRGYVAEEDLYSLQEDTRRWNCQLIRSILQRITVSWDSKRGAPDVDSSPTLVLMMHKNSKG